VRRINLGFGAVGYRDEAFATEYTFPETSWREGPGHTRDRGQVLRRQPAGGDSLKALVVSGIYGAEARIAQPKRFLQHCVEHRPEVTRRRVDDLQHLGGRGLLGESLVTLDCPLSQLPLRFVPFGSAFGKLTLQIGDELLGID
jgi:hypothetical protein